MNLINNYLVRLWNRSTDYVVYLRCYNNIAQQYYNSNFNRIAKPVNIESYKDIPFQSIDEYITALRYIDGAEYSPSGKLGYQGTVLSDKSLYVIVDKEFPYISYDNNVYPYESLARLKITELGLENKLVTITKYDLIINQNSRYNS